MTHSRYGPRSTGLQSTWNPRALLAAADEQVSEGLPPVFMVRMLREPVTNAGKSLVRNRLHHQVHAMKLPDADPYPHPPSKGRQEHSCCSGRRGFCDAQSRSGTLVFNQKIPGMRIIALFGIVDGQTYTAGMCRVVHSSRVGA